MKCLHMSGAGNDFMVVDARGQESELDFAKMAVALCAKTHADGFMAVGNSDIADFRLHFYNSDGSRGEMCGNGARCICKYAYDHGIAGEAMTVQTDAGLVPGWRIAENLYRIHLNNPSILDFYRRNDAVYVELGEPGIPHSVTELPHLYWEMAEILRPTAKRLRFAGEYPKGANVNFYAWTTDTSVRILTYERGVEDYTLACGTGCGSTAVVMHKLGLLPGGVLTAHNRGGILRVEITESEGSIATIRLEGPTEVVKIYEL